MLRHFLIERHQPAECGYADECKQNTVRKLRIAAYPVQQEGIGKDDIKEHKAQTQLDQELEQERQGRNQQNRENNLFEHIQHLSLPVLSHKKRECAKNWRDEINMEIKINREVRTYHETIFFGLSARQFFCSLGAVAAAVGVYFLLKDILGKETTSWLCMVCAAPLAVAGFFSYNGLPLERFLWAVCKTMVLCAGRRLYRSENQYAVLLDASPKKNRRYKHNEKNNAKET